MFFDSKDELIRPHIIHLMKAYYFLTDVPIFFMSPSHSVIETYPESNWAKQDTAKKMMPYITTDLNRTISLTLDEQFVFFITPIKQNLNGGDEPKDTKGYLVAGPIVLCGGYAPSIISELPYDVRTMLSSNAVLKKPPKHLYLGDLLRMLVHQGLNHDKIEHILPKRPPISKEIMQNFTMNLDMHERILQISDLVINHKKHEAISLYKLSFLFDDVYEGDAVTTLKQALFTMESIVSSALIQMNIDRAKTSQVKNSYFNQIMKCGSYTCLMSLGENIIKVYGEMISRKEWEGKSPHVRKAAMYIHEHFRESIQVEHISDYVRLSSTYLSSKFKEEMSLSLSEYIQKTRIQFGIHLIKNTTLSIAEVAIECGFDNQNYFATVFKKWTGTTPKKMRD